MRTLKIVVVSVLLLLGPQFSDAQSLSQTNRSFFPSLTALGMGDAGVAFPTKSTAFYYNPAHFVHTASILPSIQLAGAQVRLGSSAIDAWNFYRKDLRDALDRGYLNLTPAERTALNEKAYEVAGEPTFIGAGIPGPSAMMRLGPIGAGVGLNGFSYGRYVMREGPQGVPHLDFQAVADLQAVAAGGVNLSSFGFPLDLTLGAAVRFTERRVTFKEDKSLLAMSQREPFYLFKGRSISYDVGFLYEVPLMLPGTLRLGGAAYDVVTTDASFAFDRRLAGRDNAATLAIEEARAENLFSVSPSYRIGASYTVPSLFGLLGDTGVAIDYVGHSDPLLPDQTFRSRLHVGAQATVLRIVSARAGLSQGYGSVGAGLNLGLIKIDYALLASEEDPGSGKTPAWTHLAQLTVGF